MNEFKQIRTALVSLYHKNNLEDILSVLQKFDIDIISTGGTYKAIKENGVDATSIEELTSYPSILGGRVKTLHPVIFGGILNRSDNKTDQEDKEQYKIPGIDLVIVDLYPFEESLQEENTDEDIIEKIDIGGIALIRAAAKNYNDTLVISHKNQYESLTHLLENNQGGSYLEERKKFAREAFATSAHYDTCIFDFFNQDEESSEFRQSLSNKKELRYGENPHQKGAFYGNFEQLFDKIHGKEISYNNLLDIDAGINLIEEFEEDTTFAILKHNNACGLASREKLVDAYKAALEGDPVSAFGGILVSNTKIDPETANEIHKLFFEVIIAPAYDDEALSILKQKKNRIILTKKAKLSNKKIQRTALNGLLVQDKDYKQEQTDELKIVTDKKADTKTIEDLLFGNIIVKHSKSNAIVIAKNKQLIASGVGQTSRVDALKQAIEKGKYFGFDLNGAIMASDAFFPFADSVEIAHGEGINDVIQPGGSKRDQDSIDYCNANNMAMVFTGIRHFKH